VLKGSHHIALCRRRCRCGTIALGLRKKPSGRPFHPDIGCYLLGEASCRLSVLLDRFCL
jgi:hypothetical protein